MPEPGAGLGAGEPAPLGARRKVLLAAEILALYPRVRWLLARQELPRAVELLRRPGHSRHRGCRVEAAPARCAGAVERVLRLLPTDSRCLIRSLVLLALLRRRGIEARLVIGALSRPRFAAHAWVEYRGTPLLAPGAAAAGRLVEL